MAGPDPSAAADTGGERIAKRLARAGLCSRREAEKLIEAGRVAVDGVTLSTPAFKVHEGQAITVDGEPLAAPERVRAWRFHKPEGLVTTNRDPEGRQTVFDALPEDMPRVLTVGRLDITSEGLLLLTNDGGLARTLEHPSTGWTRRYRVRAFGRIEESDLERLSEGLTWKGVRYGPIEAKLERRQGANAWITVALKEGKNREVRNALEALGLKVNRLIRTAYGPFQLGSLEPGSVEEIPLRVLKDQLGSLLPADPQGAAKPRRTRKSG